MSRPATSPTRADRIRSGAREQMRAAILESARTQLASDGASGLSLRAVARDVGLASSAVYRYFDSRDALLTALIIDAYNSVGSAVERREAAVDRSDLMGRWLAVAHGVRDWASADPHQYALVYGSPVPGYAAPQDTIGPATRGVRVLAHLLADVSASSHPAPGCPTDADLEPALVEAVAPAASFVGGDLPYELVLRGLMAWTFLFGAVSFELFGQLHNTVAPHRRGDYFTAQVTRIAVLLGLGEEPPRRAVG